MKPLLATYRVQFRKEFGFQAAAEQVPYLARLGVTHLYASPIFAARPGSSHGYDVTDPTCLNPELGGEAGFAALQAALRAAGMGLILDIVPNHMALDRHNPFWMEVLACGPAAPSRAVFDIDWQRRAILLPLLGDTLAATLARGEIKLGWHASGYLLAHYYEEAAPLCPRSTAALLHGADLNNAAQAWEKLEEALAASTRRGADTTTEVVATALKVARAALAALPEDARARLDATLAAADLPALLEAQYWQLAHWRSGRDRLTHRRFFDITGLIGVRVEDPAVFELVHRLPLRLLREGQVQGLRVDHVDGLADPAGYCARLRAEAGPEALLVLEKILGHAEPLRPWPVDGTTGYERLTALNALFVNPEGYAALRDALQAEGALPGTPAERLADAKRAILAGSLAAELENLLRSAQELAAQFREGAEFGPDTLRRATLALLAHFPVYRSYITAVPAGTEDMALYAQTLEALRATEEPWTQDAAAFLIFCLTRAPGEAAALFRQRFQQLSGPAMAKGCEDTEFYRYIPLLSVNEVGGEVAHPCLSAEEACRRWEERAGTAPRDLTPLATHDTKRGADTRARLNALSHDAPAWVSQCSQWRNALRAPRTAGTEPDAGPDAGPDTLEEWLIYQTMLGAWPLTTARLREYLTKALREAKRHTSWEAPDEAYESAVLDHAQALLEAPQAAEFRRQMQGWATRMALPGRVFGLAQTILQLTLPGVADIYQGTEFWDHSLVDPDNRRPVDYARRAAALESMARSGPPPLSRDVEGLCKLWVTARLLALRQARPELILRGSFHRIPLPRGWLGFCRRVEHAELQVVVPLLPPSALPPLPRLPEPACGHWRDILCDQPVEGPPDAAWPFRVVLAA